MIVVVLFNVFWSMGFDGVEGKKNQQSWTGMTVLIYPEECSDFQLPKNFLSN